MCYRVRPPLSDLADSYQQALLDLVHASKITMFHQSWVPGHGSTDYPHFYSLPPASNTLYRVTTYQHAYEPYIIFDKSPSNGIPWCDERFRGYGGNKAACLFEMYLSGVEFWVLSDDFIVHRSHAYKERIRAQEVNTRYFHYQLSRLIFLGCVVEKT